MKKTHDKVAFKLNGFAMLGLTVFMACLSAYLIWARLTGWSAIPILATTLLAIGLFPVQPNDSRVLIFLGNYTGTLRDEGFWWVNPFAIRRQVSLRIRNFNSDRLKVNDADGNPIEIAAVVVWKVINPASAIFDVDDYVEFVTIQSETAIRSLCGHYSYDSSDPDKISLRGHPEDVASTLKQELEARLQDAAFKIGGGKWNFCLRKMAAALASKISPLKPITMDHRTKGNSAIMRC